MRRLGLSVAIGSLFVLMLLCGVGSLRAWSSQGQNLVMRDASDVRIERRGAARLHITYRLPPHQTRYHLRRFLIRQGWQRARVSNIDRETSMAFVRPNWSSRVREILIVTTDPRNHQLVDMQFGRCVTIGTWVNCL
jgi:hypothetical protein